MFKVKHVSIGLGVAGVIVLLLGVILGWIVAPKVIDNKVKSEAQLKNGTEIYDKWSDLPVPIYLKCYFFNVTNADEFQEGNWSTKPILQEIGPYVYKEKRVKYEIKSNKAADTVSYRQNITYTFVRELSVGDETDTVNMINAPLITVATILQTIDEKLLPFPHKYIMDALLGPMSREKFIKPDVMVRDIMFGTRLNFIYDIFIWVATTFYGMSFPPEIQGGKFGVYLNKNGTNVDGLWEVFSGVKDTSKIGRIKYVNGQNAYPEYWDGDCAVINGTDGTMFPPFIKKDSVLYIFSIDVCRSVWLKYTKEIEFEGIPGYRFEVPREVFTSPLLYPPNQCYCMPVPPPLNGTCDFSGGGRLFSCKNGVPIVVSKPHFLDADEFVLSLIDGMTPNKELHDTFMDIEPTLGFPLRARKRIQLGMETQPLPMGAPWNTIPFMFFPFMWAEEDAQLDEKLIKEVKSKLITPLKLVKIGKWTAVGVGILLIVSGATGFGYFMWKNP